VSPPGEFFVGYLPLPPGQRRFAVRIGAVALLAAVLLAASLAASLPASPGDPRVDYSHQLEGLYAAEPYGMVFSRDAAGVHATLLTQGGKHGVISPGDPLDGKVVHAAGLLLERDGGRLLELGEGLRGVAGADAGPLREALQAARQDLGEVTLRGQIEDGKCFMGRMRPGSGAAHRACAQLCVRGGIPPVLVTRDAEGRATPYVLATRQGHAINAEILPLLVEPVEVRGHLERVGDLFILRTDAASVQRL